MKPIPIDANGSKLQGLLSTIGTCRIASIPTTGVTVVTPADIKKLSITTDSASAFLVNGLGTITGEGLIEDASKTINNAPAVDKGGGLVGIPCTSHGYAAGSTVRIAGTTNYNDSYVLDATTSTNEMVITETYAAENFAGTETVRQQRTSWTNEISCPGSLVVDIATDTALTLTIKSAASTVNANILIGR